jgi:hypothetical protein
MADSIIRNLLKMADKQATNAKTETANALLKEIQSMNNTQSEYIVTRFSAELQALLLSVQELNSKIIVLEKILAEKKKPAVRAAAKPTEGTATAEAPEVATEAAPDNKKTTFIANKLVYFRENYKKNPEYRQKYVSAELRKMLDEDPVIAGKQKEDQKLIAESTFCWKYFSSQDKETLTKIENEYKEAKAAHEALNKQPQQAVEPRTPPNEPAGK